MKVLESGIKDLEHLLKTMYAREFDDVFLHLYDPSSSISNYHCFVTQWKQLLHLYLNWGA